MGGHVFIVRSDLTALGCDAWLLPTDRGLSVGERWTDHLSPPVRARLEALRADRAFRPATWQDGRSRVIPLADAAGTSAGSRPYLVDVGGWDDTPVSWYVEGVRQFFDVVAGHAVGWVLPRRGGRALVGLPVVGTGRGGAHGVKGSIVQAIVDAVHHEADARDVDIVLVTNDRPMFIAAQHARRRHLRGRHPEVPTGWPDLSPALAAEATRLAAHAVDEQLVVFIGAGVSRASGLPNWTELLERIATEAGVGPHEVAALGKLHELDRARIVQHRLGLQERKIGDVVRDVLGTAPFTLAHALLASLPIREAVTTNYDELFEQASAAAGEAAAVLPYESVRERSRWLLKLHGSVSRPDDIVLTREDYLRYADRRAALGGIVQAMLITRHMLFVGFSLTDDNFHRTIDEVRKAIRGVGAATDAKTKKAAVFGSVLKLEHDDLWNELWRRDLDIVSFAEPDEPDVGAASRRLEIFLDFLLAEASQKSPPLLDPAFEGVLTDDERKIASLLVELTKGLEQVRGTPALTPIAKLLRSLGGDALAASLVPDETPGPSTGASAAEPSER